MAANSSVPIRALSTMIENDDAACAGGHIKRITSSLEGCRKQYPQQHQSAADDDPECASPELNDCCGRRGRRVGANNSAVGVAVDRDDRVESTRAVSRPRRIGHRVQRQRNFRSGCFGKLQRDVAGPNIQQNNDDEGGCRDRADRGVFPNPQAKPADENDDDESCQSGKRGK